MVEPRSLQAVFNHLFLPPQLPDIEDTDVDEVAENLQERWLAAARSIRDKGSESVHNVANAHMLTSIAPDAYTGALQSVSRALKASQTIYEGGAVSRLALTEALQKLENGDFVVLHIAAQNAGVIIKKDKGAYMVDAFEASAKSSEVLASTAALQWEFPGISISIPDNVILVC